MELHANGASFLAQTRESNPLDFVKKAISTLPNGDRKERFKKFEEMLDGEEEYERAVRWYFFVNMHDYLTTKRSTSVRDNDRRQARNEVIRQMAETIKEKIQLLNLVLPNGKLLRDATFADCSKAQGWFGKVAKMGKLNQIVGRVLTEEKLRAIK